MTREIIFIVTFVLTIFLQGIVSQNNPDKGRIVGGYPVDIRSRPFQVALYADGSFCGGSIIAINKVLTAAHCVRGKLASKSLVYVGSSARNTGGYIHYLSAISVHPSYDPTRSMNYDVAVLTVATPFRYSTNIQPIRLLTSRPNPGNDAVVSGWGSVRSGVGIETYLRAVNIPIVSQTQCQSQYGTSTITSNMICAGLSAGGKDSCQGDSGGPLTANGGLAGVVSFGNGCALPGYAGVYASVPDLLSWIETQ